MKTFSPTGAARLSLATGVFTLVLKFGAWALTGSVGLLADATESVVNVAAAGLTLTLIALARKPADRRHPFGHHKAEYLASGAEGGLILAAAVSIAWTSVQRLLNPQPLADLGVGLGIAIVAAILNYLTARQLLKSGREHTSIALEADAKHLLTDVWTTAGVVAGLGLAGIIPRGELLDPIIAIVLAAHIAITGWGLLRRSLDGLLDHALPEDDMKAVLDAIRRVAGPEAAFHGLRTRCSGPMCFVDFHLLMPGRTTVAESHRMTTDIEGAIQKHLPGALVTIHVEPLEDKDSFDGHEIGGESSPAGDGPS